MKTRAALIAIFIAAFAGGLVAMCPLSFALGHSSLTAQGVTWQQARGTIWKGQIAGLAVNGQPAGALDIRFDASAMLRGDGTHAVRWVSDFGQGHALLSFGAGEIRARQAALEISPRLVPGRPAQWAVLDGALKVRQLQLDWSGAACATAAGAVSTDIAARTGANYGEAWPDLTGTLRCADGALALDLKGGDAEQNRMEVSLDTKSPPRLAGPPMKAETQAALAFAGVQVQMNPPPLETKTP